MRRWIKIVVLAISFVIAAMLGLWFTVNTAQDFRWLRSASTIESRLQDELAKGSSREHIDSYFKAHNATVISSSTQAGFLSRDDKVVGSGHLRVRLGGYRLLLSWVDVTATAGFDSEDRLVGLEVGKYVDSL